MHASQQQLYAALLQEREARIQAETSLVYAEALRRDYEKERALRLEAQAGLREAQALRR